MSTRKRKNEEEELVALPSDDSEEEEEYVLSLSIHTSPTFYRRGFYHRGIYLLFEMPILFMEPKRLVLKYIFSCIAVFCQ